jgi:hypothetical protein
MTQLMAFSKSGKNVLTATDIDDFVFHSDYDTLKYESQGTIDVTVNYSNYYKFVDGFGFTADTYYHYKVETLSHGLDYTPYFAGYILDLPISGNAIQAPYAFGSGLVAVYYSVYADDSNLYFLIHIINTQDSGTLTIPFAYRVFKNDLGI